jgi:hypothetical protein
VEINAFISTSSTVNSCKAKNFTGVGVSTSSSLGGKPLAALNCPFDRCPNSWYRVDRRYPGTLAKFPKCWVQKSAWLNHENLSALTSLLYQSWKSCSVILSPRSNPPGTSNLVWPVKVNAFSDHTLGFLHTRSHGAIGFILVDERIHSHIHIHYIINRSPSWQQVAVDTNLLKLVGLGKPYIAHWI